MAFLGVVTKPPTTLGGVTLGYRFAAAITEVDAVYADGIDLGKIAYPSTGTGTGGSIEGIYQYNYGTHAWDPVPEGP